MDLPVLDLFLDKRRQWPHLGLAIFAAGPDVVAAVTARCRAAALLSAPITLSRLTSSAVTLPPTPQMPLIIQDLPPEQLPALLPALVGRLIYPCYIAGRPYCFLSALPRDHYTSVTITPADIHGRPHAITAQLLREQLLDLLEETAVRAVTPVSPAHFPPVARVRRQRATAFALDDNLDDEQRHAVTHGRGPLQVLAPAGSGKTKTLVNRILHLRNEGVPGPAILALAFNKQAQEEMSARLDDRGAGDVVVRTFHALGYAIIRRALGWRYDGETAVARGRRLLRGAVESHYPLPPRRDGDPLAPFANTLLRLQTELPPLDTLTVATGDDELPFAPIFDTYLHRQSRTRHLAFADMVYLAVRLLLNDTSRRQRLQSRFHHVLVDEFQDLNRAQLLLMTLLAAPHDNLFVVGDDDQMIYGWRGARVDHVLAFPDRYLTTGRIVLATNYRSSRAVVTHSGRLIGHNRVRVPKTITPRAGAPAGALRLAWGENLADQARHAAAWIAGHHPPDVAALYRYRLYQYPLALALDERAIPHTGADLPALYRSAVGQDMAAYLTLILTPETAVATHWQRALRRPNRYLTNDQLATLNDETAVLQATRHGRWPNHARRALRALLRALARLRQLAVRPGIGAAELIYHLDRLIGLHADYAALPVGDGATEAGAAVALEILTAVAAFFDSPPHFLATLQAPLPARDVDPAAAVTLSTIHQAKGKEWPAVVVYNLSRGAHSRNPAEMEEERRIVYVAVTRAQERLLLTARQGEPSLFLRQLLLEPTWAMLSRTELTNLLRQRPPDDPQRPAIAAELHWRDQLGEKEGD